MTAIDYSTGGKVSRVYVGKPWREVTELIDTGNTIIITDDNLYGIYGNEFPGCRVVSLPPGESTKSLAYADKLLAQLMELGAGRSTFILGIGGGVICDIAGFAASVYMRGVRFGFISTSLLSQVDASIGGKNGVNLNGIKNIIGTFNQPEFVLCDPVMLSTLPSEEYLSGLAEVLKYALIRDVELLGFIEDNIDRLLAADRDVLDIVIPACVKIKTSIVENDEKENGERRLLNFGHTTGHAIESLTGMAHGYAVAYGMVLAIHFSVEEGLLDNIMASRIINTIRRLGFLNESEIDPGKLPDVILKDKKRVNDEIHFIFLEAPGKGVVRKIQLSRLVEFLISNP